MTVLVSVPELFARFGSVTLELALDVLVNVPAAVGVTTMVTVAVAPALSVPSEQFTTWLPAAGGVHVPTLAAAEPKVTAGGQVTVMVTGLTAANQRDTLFADALQVTTNDPQGVVTSQPIANGQQTFTVTLATAVKDVLGADIDTRPKQTMPCSVWMGTRSRISSSFLTSTVSPSRDI